MTTYTAALEALDQKRGHVHTVADWQRIGQKAQDTPADLTDDDVIVLEGFGGPSSTARARRAQALAPPPPPDPPAVATTSAAPARVPVELPDRLWDDDAPDVVQAMEQWSDTYAMKAVPIALWHSFMAAGRDKREALAAKVATLEQRIASLESKPHVKFCGVWKSGRTYEPGDAATHQGGLWICKAATPGEPSKDFGGWTLAVKRGSI